jgi:hypothetical protein
MKIASANPDSMNSSWGLSVDSLWAQDLEVDKLTRSSQQDSFHKGSLGTRLLEICLIGSAIRRKNCKIASIVRQAKLGAQRQSAFC